MTTTQFPQVLTKHDFVKRYSIGEFGNAAPTWDSLESWKRCNGPIAMAGEWLYHIRNRVAGAATWYNIKASLVELVWDEIVKKGTHKKENLYISAMAPTAKTIIQGEVQQGVNGLELFYTKVALPMREALAIRSVQISGIIAKCTLQNRMCANSWDWLQILLDRYPFHVIEFSTYSVQWGTLPRFNTVFWEVRQY